VESEAETRGRKLLYLVSVLILSLLITNLYSIAKEKISELSCAIERKELEAEKEKIVSEIERLCGTEGEDLKGLIEEFESKVRNLEACKDEGDLKIQIVLMIAPVIIGIYLLHRWWDRKYLLIKLAKARIMLEQCESEKEDLKAKKEALEIQMEKLKKIKDFEARGKEKSYVAGEDYLKYEIYEPLRHEGFSHPPESKKVVEQKKP
jgi:cell division protein FtsB